MKDILQIIQSIDTKQININPTEIYNEGWMVRLLVKKSLEEGIIISGIDFSQIANWTSEALISSPFILAPTNREGYTRADIAVGDFEVDYVNRGEIIVEKNARIFGIFEAKMKSKLSQRTSYAEDYNQASRNVACILSNTMESTECFFCVVAPEKYIKKHEIKLQIDKSTISRQLRKRFAQYDNAFRLEQNEHNLVERINDINIFTISYESWIDSFQGETKKILKDFYDKSCKWNRL